MKKLFLVDAYALIFKYYYAFLGRPMRNREGMNTSVVFGFVKFLRDIQKRERPDLLGVAFDPKGGSFRRDIFPEYKANRSETPEDILLSIPYVKRVLDAMCIPILEVAGSPGILSEASPHSARMSRTSCGSSMPYFSRMASRSTISMLPSAPRCL